MPFRGLCAYGVSMVIYNFDHTFVALQALFDTATSGASPPPPSPPPPPPPAGAAALSDIDCANNPSCYYTMVWDKKLEYLFIYHFFGLLWTNQFIVGFG